MTQVFDFIELFWEATVPFWLGLAVFWVMLLCLIGLNRWLEQKAIARWSRSNSRADTEEAMPDYTRRLLEGRLRPEEVEEQTSGKISAGDVVIEWGPADVEVTVDGKTCSLTREQHVRLQLSRASEPAVPRWWFGAEPAHEWLAVAIRFAEHEVRLQAPIPSDWGELVLPELNSNGEDVPLASLLSLLESAAFHELTLAEHRRLPTGESTGSQHNSSPAERHASWIYLIAPPISAVVLFVIAGLAIKHLNYRGHTLPDQVRAVAIGIGIGGMLGVFGGMLFGLVTSRYTRRLVRFGVWPDAAGPRKRKYNHHLRYAIGLTWIWFAAGAPMAAANTWLPSGWVMPAIGLCVGATIFATHKLITSRGFILGPAEPHSRGPHVALEYGRDEILG